MKLVLSVEALAPKLTGIGRYVWELASRVPQQLGVEQVRFYRQGQWVSDPSTLLQESVQAAVVQSVARLKWPRWIRRSVTEHRVRAVVKECQGKVFHGPNYFLPPCADLGVVTVHDLSVFKFPQTHPLERIQQFEQLFEESIARANHVITDSEATRQEVMDFLGWGPEKITAVPLGVSNRFMPANGFEQVALSVCLQRYGLQRGGYTLCVSTMEPRKKIDSLLQAYQRVPVGLRGRYPLVLVGGRGWLSETLHAEIERFAAQGWLKYLGFVPEADLPALYAGARTFAFPSVYEGFGLPVLEAMASGVPVVASDRSSIPEVTQGAALLGDPDDLEVLSTHLARSLEDEAWRNQAVVRGIEAAKGLTWQRCIEKTIEVYKKTIANA